MEYYLLNTLRWDSKDQNGQPFNIIELEMSNKRIIPGDDEPSSYINFYIANQGIVMPRFDDEKAEKDTVAKKEPNDKNSEGDRSPSSFEKKRQEAEHWKIQQIIERRDRF